MGILAHNRRYLPHEIVTRIQSVIRYRETKDWRYVCRKYKISRASLLRWNKQYDGTRESIADKSHKPRRQHPNPTGIQAKPLITITGSGNITLLVGMQIIQLKGITNGIVLDSDLQEAYWENTLKNSSMTGEFPVLGEGRTAISWTGGSVSEVKVTPRWVSL